MASPGFVFTNSDMSLNQAQTVWSSLRKGISQIQNGNASSLRYEQLYRNAYTLVLHKHGGLLHDGVVQTIQEKLGLRNPPPPHLPSLKTRIHRPVENRFRFRRSVSSRFGRRMG
jgi:hypothetical protein